MVSTTLCYVERDGCYLMLHRVKKKNDLNEGKWIGIGGHVEAGETPDACVVREAYEEAGIRLTSFRLRGVVEFVSARWEDEHMYLYTADAFEGEVGECDEGVLRWVPRGEIFDLPLWEGDRIFLGSLLAEEPFFHLEVRYGMNDELISSRKLDNLILASASPRRRSLLAQIGLEPVVLPSPDPEIMKGDAPGEVVSHLAACKAEAVAARFCSGEVVIGADTVVSVDGHILGKPGTHEEAADMIRSLQGRTHQVYTGVCLIRCGAEERRRVFYEKTDVRVSPMSEEEIRAYASGPEPMDKAGAYGIQGAFAAFVSGIDGDYSNVVGLPLARLYQEMKEI